MSAWSDRGFMHRVRLAIAVQTVEANGGDLFDVTNRICAMRPELDRREVHAKVKTWMQAALDETEGTAAYGRRLRAARAGDLVNETADFFLDENTGQE